MPKKKRFTRAFLPGPSERRRTHGLSIRPNNKFARCGSRRNRRKNKMRQTDGKLNFRALRKAQADAAVEHGSAFRFRTANDRHMLHRLPFRESELRVGIKCPVVERGMILPVVRVGKRYADELHTVALTARDEASARGFRVPGLAAVHAAAAPEQLVVVHICYTVDTAAAHGEYLCEHVVLKRRSHNEAEIVRGGTVSVGIEPVGISKVRDGKAKFLRFAVHLLNERIAAERTGDSERGVVAGSEQQPFQKLAERIALPGTKVHGRALYRCPLALHRNAAFRCGEIERGKRRHKFCCARNEHRRIGVFLCKYRAGFCVEHDHRFCRSAGRRGCRRSRGREQDRRCKNQNYRFFHK